MKDDITSEIHSRIKKFQELLKENHIFAALIQKPRNLYYFSGTGQPANLWIPAEGEPILFTRRAHELALKDSPLQNIQKAANFKEMYLYLEEINNFPNPASIIGVESDIIPFNMIRKFQETFHGIVLQNITPQIMAQRLIKSEYEIQKIRNAAVLWQKGHNAILETNAAGKKEYEIAACMEYAARKNGGDGLIYFHRWDGSLPGGGIVSSGEAAWVVSGHAMTVTGVGLSAAHPWGASNRTLKNGDLVVVDYGICKEGYHSDMARTYSVGRPSTQKLDLWQRLVDLHLSVIDNIRPDITGAELYQIARKIVKEVDLEQYFMGVENERGDYIGHSIGLEIDEWPVIGPKANLPLKENTVITIEPKFMVPGLGSVMVEDDILVTSNGYEIIGSIGHELFEI